MILIKYILVGFVCSAALIACAKGFMGKLLHKDEVYYEKKRQKKSERGNSLE